MALEIQLSSAGVADFATGLLAVAMDDNPGAATLDGLASVAGHLRSRIGRALRLRLAPEISFKLDESVARAARIESLLAQIHENQPESQSADESPKPPSRGDSTD